MPLPEGFLNELRERADIVDLFSTYAAVKKRGRTYVCCCPFHSEKTPSCTIYPDNQSFYCFGCGAGGSTITFVQRMENLSFMDAVRTLAQRVGMQMPLQDSQEARQANVRRRCYEINREAANFYYLNLLQGTDKRGLQYFRQRRLSPATIKAYGLGYAPDDWNALRDHLKQKGYSEQELVTAGVCRSSAKGNVFDQFRGRAMFPIVDLQGSVIGFGGRVLDDSKPKYLNTNETPVFDKGSNLFSLHFAKNASTNTLILAEGYMDVIALYQAGFPNAVATLGTAITSAQARKLSQYAREIVIAYDSDTAGQTATQRALNRFSEVGLPARILKMEGAKDPDEYIRTFGADSFRRLVEQAGDAINFQLDKCKDGLDLSTEQGKDELLRRSVAILAGIENPLQREVYTSRTAREMDVRVEVLRQTVDAAVLRQQRAAKKIQFHAIESRSLQRDELNPLSQKFPRESRAEQMILAYLLRNPEDHEMLWESLSPSDFVTDLHRRIYLAVCEQCREHRQFSLPLLEETFTVEEMGRISGIAARSQELPVSRDALEECIRVLKAAHSRVLPGETMTDDDLLQVVANQRKKQ